jgi:iron-only hydrogenase group A
MSKISITINGKDCLVESGESVLSVAADNGIDIPSLCFHPDVEAKHHCGMCVVNIDGKEPFTRACAVQVTEGMRIVTDSEAIENERKKNLDAILQKHLMECDDCVWFQRCKLLELVKQFKAKPVANKDERDAVVQVGTMVFDQTKCIGCENCVSVCPTGFLDLNERDKVQCSTDGAKDCISCGQCILHCPVGAIEGVGEFEELEKLFQDTSKVIVAQFAPSIRTSIGDEFGMNPGEIATGRLVSALREVGFAYVFDTAAGADFTTMEESDELIERLTKNEKLPAMTSCCPAWVKFVEFNYPEFIPNLCTSRSPQIMSGGIIKQYWSKQKNINPKDVLIVSIMPCVSKKFEIAREELTIDGVRPVDMVLTTRELARLFKKRHIDMRTLQESEADSPLGAPSGSGVIYGASGGVFESALRTAFFKMTGETLPQNAVADIRGMDGIKTKEVTIGDKMIKMCVVSGIKNAITVLEALKKNPRLYDAVEVMACPGGCVGGGGQPLPTTQKIAQERAKSLYNIDDASLVKCAYENQAVQKIYEEFFTDHETRKKILHTHFSPREKEKIQRLKNSKETYG